MSWIQNSGARRRGGLHGDRVAVGAGADGARGRQAAGEGGRSRHGARSRRRSDAMADSQPAGGLYARAAQGSDAPGASGTGAPAARRSRLGRGAAAPGHCVPDSPPPAKAEHAASNPRCRRVDAGLTLRFGARRRSAARRPSSRSTTMPQAVQNPPQGYHTVTPYLTCSGAAAAIDFYKKAFGAEELLRCGGPDGKVAHAEIKIGDSIIMLADENEDGAPSPQTLGGTPVVPDALRRRRRRRVRRAVAAGGKVEAGRGPVLRRPLRHAQGSVRPPVDASRRTRRTCRPRRWSGAWKPFTARPRRIAVVMESKQLHRGRLIDHVHLIARDLAASRRFYDAALGAVGRKVEGEGDGYFWLDELFVSSDAMATSGATHVHLAFQAADLPRRRRPLLRRRACRRRQGPWQAGHSPRVPPGLLRRLRDRSRRQQHRGRLPRRGRPVGRVGGDPLQGIGAARRRRRQPRPNRRAAPRRP